MGVRKPCAICGRPFIARHGALTCSEACHKERKRKQGAENQRRRRAEKPEECKAVRDAWRARNKEREAGYMRASRAADPQGHKLYMRVYREMHKERLRDYGRQRRERAKPEGKYCDSETGVRERFAGRIADAIED